MFKTRYLLKLSVAYLMRFKGIIVLGIIFGMASFIVVRIASNLFLGKNIERIGLTGRYTPDKLPLPILNLISYGLTTIDELGSPKQGAAASWQTPDKGKTWTFILDKDISWQDQTPLTSKEINFELTDLSIEKPDGKTISFKLKYAFSPFPSVVSKPIFKKGLLGLGEWNVTKISLQGSFVEQLVIQNEKKDTKIFKFYPTSDRTKLAYKLGEVDKLIDLLNAEPFNSWRNTKVESLPNRKQIVTIFFNTKDPLLSGKSFRQALAYGINKNSFEDTRAISPISSLSWAYNPQVKQYNYDIKRAKELIDELPKELKDKLEIKLISSPILLSTAESIVKNWEEMGIKTVLQVSSVIPTDFQAFLTIFEIPDDPDQYPIWHSTQEETNISKYSNPRIDKLLEDGRIELELEERKKIYLDFQRFLLEDLPAVFLYHPLYYTVSKTK